MSLRASHLRWLTVFAVTGGLLLSGCDQPKSPNSAAQTGAVQAKLPDSFFLAQEPANAKTVEEVKQAAKAGDPVAMRGRVGGSKEPFVDGRAVFTLMGPGIPSCKDNMAPDACKTPWDYCCETSKDITAHSATIQIVDSGGAPLRLSMKAQNGIQELSELVVVGKIKQADGPLLIVDASGIYVAKR